MAKLLIVEDDETTAQLVALYLSGAGHQVEEALSAPEAV
ncbi:MAG: response regulator, partial [Deltaproteobacteria bacterium]|nr:response regulator [Deltaproteobacteria bacterium]